MIYGPEDPRGRASGRMGYTISSQGVWLPGAYADERSARYAFRFSYADLFEVNKDRGTGENYRLITFDDLKAYKEAANG